MAIAPPAALRLIIGLALVVLLYRWRLIDPAALGGLLLEPRFLGPALAVALATIPLEALRWQILLRAQGLALPYLTTVRVLAASLFFGIFLPGGAGGDLMRGAHLYKAAKGRRAAALSSILADRFIGFVGFLLVGIAAVAARPFVPAIGLAITGAAASVAAAALVAAFCSPAAAAALRRRLPRLAHLIADAEAAARQYARAWRSAALALALSLAIVVLGVTPVVMLAVAMGVPGISPFDYGTAGLYALLANSLPVTPGGLGVGEAGFASAMALLAPNAHAAFGTIFLAYRGIFALATLPGFVAYLAKG
jgi:glycosyltransferase 2 family protein